MDAARKIYNKWPVLMAQKQLATKLNLDVLRFIQIFLFRLSIFVGK